MAEVSTIARPYAKAAFEYADSRQALAQWSELLVQASAVASNADILRVLASPAVDSAQKAAVFIEVCGGDIPEGMQNFVRTMAENKRLQLMPRVAKLFEALKAAREAAIDVEVTSAFALTPEQETKLTAELKNKWQKEVSLKTKVDKSLIGGVIIRAGDLVLDGSIRGKLARVAEAVGS